MDVARLGAELRTHREFARLTQEQVAKRTGLKQTEVSRIERGAKAGPTFEEVARLARLYGVSLDRLAAALELPPGAPAAESAAERFIRMLAALDDARREPILAMIRGFIDNYRGLGEDRPRRPPDPPNDLPLHRLGPDYQDP